MNKNPDEQNFIWVLDKKLQRGSSAYIWHARACPGYGGQTRVQGVAGHARRPGPGCAFHALVQGAPGHAGAWAIYILYLMRYLPCSDFKAALSFCACTSSHVVRALTPVVGFKGTF
jgi:hypothetical protein